MSGFIQYTRHNMAVTYHDNVLFLHLSKGFLRLLASATYGLILPRWACGFLHIAFVPVFLKCPISLSLPGQKYTLTFSFTFPQNFISHNYNTVSQINTINQINTWHFPNFPPGDFICNISLQKLIQLKNVKYITVPPCPGNRR